MTASDRYKRIKPFLEDEASSDSADGLDIVKEVEKSLDFSQHIRNLTQTQSDQEEQPGAITDDALDADETARTPLQPSESDWSSDDPEAAYRAFVNRKNLKRKRVAAETKRIRAQKKSRAAAATSIIGRKPLPSKINGKHRRPNILGDTSDSDKGDGQEAIQEEDLPDYLESRRKKLKRLQDAGLKYPPALDDIDLSGFGDETRPDLPSHIKPQRPLKDIRLRGSKGIVPAPIAQWLRDYQVDGVKFLHERFVRQKGAILGDDMGLGKTIQIIAFLTAAFGKSATRGDSKLMRKVRNLNDRRWYPKVLIVCPGTLMQNWQDELDKWGWWSIYWYHGKPDEKQAAIEAASRGMLEIMITTYTTYRNNESEINTIDWDCVIADECHEIKNKNSATTKAMNKVNALCRFGLTGTAIQNKYEEMWALLNWARPGDYGTNQSWKQLVSMPLKVGQSHDATHEQLASARLKAKELVEDVLPDVFLRRMKTLIADQLPKKSDRVVFCQLTEQQADAYRNLTDSEIFEYVKRSNEPCPCESGKKRGWCCFIEIPGRGKWANYAFPCMATLQKLSSHLALLLPVGTDVQEKQAKDLEWLQLACPDTWKDLYRMRDSLIHQSQREFCGKWKVLKRLLDYWHANGDKVLIFAHKVRLLRLMKSLFDIDGTKYNYSYFDGSVSYEQRAKIVADFNSNLEQFVFLISTRAGGVGLNITSANKVVIVDPNWNPAYDLQAQDRAYRIGQTRNVDVFRLVSHGTMEEIVYARQIYKQQQANIAYTASDERRYFKGVMDEAGKKGELFGLANIFNFDENNILLREIVHKTNVAETKIGNVRAMDLAVDENDVDSDADIEDEEDILSNKSLGIEDENKEYSQVKKFVDLLTSGGTEDARGRKKYAQRSGPDPVNAILAKAGVQYTHENSEVIGRSKVETNLSKQAIEHRNDIDVGRQRVFEFSQSQSQNNPSLEEDGLEHSGIYGEEEHTPLRSGDEFKINYKYRPREDVRRRQFCSIAEQEGYKDPVEFALAVEEMTQSQRRKVLEKFYRTRRREIKAQFKTASSSFST